MRLTNKRTLVTGAQQGIGRAAVLKLAAEGADVAINWLDDETAASALADQVRAMGRRQRIFDLGRNPEHGDLNRWAIAWNCR